MSVHLSDDAAVNYRLIANFMSAIAASVLSVCAYLAVTTLSQIRNEISTLSDSQNKSAAATIELTVKMGQVASSIDKLEKRVDRQEERYYENSENSRQKRSSD